MKTAFMILLVVLATSAGEVLIARGLKQIGEIVTLKPGQLLRLGRRVTMNRDFLLGFFFMAVSFFAFLAALSRADMSYTVPATSLSYVASTLGARFILKETINLRRWMGTLLVCLGILLISLP
jgi:drug/metabolite transporter (DMT)-like permease